MRRGPEVSGRNEYSNYTRDNYEWEDPDAHFERAARTRERLRRSASEDLPDRLPSRADKRQLNPKFVGALTAVGFATVITVDAVNSGPSSFVVNNPEAATTLLAGASAAVGGMFYKIVKWLEEYDNERTGSNNYRQRRPNDRIR